MNNYPVNSYKKDSLSLLHKEKKLSFCFYTIAVLPVPCGTQTVY